MGLCHYGPFAVLTTIFRLEVQGYGMLPVLSGVGMHPGASSL